MDGTTRTCKDYTNQTYHEEFCEDTRALLLIKNVSESFLHFHQFYKKIEIDGVVDTNIYFDYLPGDIHFKSGSNVKIEKANSIANPSYWLSEEPWTKKRNPNDPLPPLPEQKNVSAQASVDKESKGDLPAIQSKQNSLNDIHNNADDSKSIQNKKPTYAESVKSNNLGTGINFGSSSSANSARTSNTTNSRSTQNVQIREQKSSNKLEYDYKHKLYLRYVPPGAKIEDLEVVFSRFGKVVDLAIYSRTGLNTCQTPGYAHITYDDPKSVQNCLSKKPLYYPENSPNGQKLDVEAKKPLRRNESSNNINRRNSGNHNWGNVLNCMRQPNSSNRLFNLNDRQQGPRANNNSSNPASAGNGGFSRR